LPKAHRAHPVQVAIERWVAHVHHLRVVHRARVRRVASRVRRGLHASRSATLRRGFTGFRRSGAVREVRRKEAALREGVFRSMQARSIRSALGHWSTRAAWHARCGRWVACRVNLHRAKALSRAVAYWHAEAGWRIERQKWMRRQVRYMHELYSVLEQARDGQRLAKRLLVVGVEPHSVHDAARAEQQLRVGCQAILRSSATLERALRRDSSLRRSSNGGGRGASKSDGEADS
jgi:hypothetical protein